MERIIAFFLFFLLSGICANCQNSKVSFNPQYQFLSSGNRVLDKNFYFLTVLLSDPNVSVSLRTGVRSMPETCIDDNSCYFNNLIWTEEENENAVGLLDRIYFSNKNLKILLDKHIRPCGYFERYLHLSDTSLLRLLWYDAARGINNMLISYTTGKSLRYPRIDSATYDVASKYYQSLLQELIHQYEANYRSEAQVYFQHSLEIALQLLEINDRNETARFEPLSVINGKCYAKSASANWKKFEYSTILVLGEGPEFEGLPISPYGKLRCQLAADHFRKGKAPFIVVSGGYVHPFQTKFCEAIGMRNYLVSECGIPEESVIVEPYARHTTTNLRNTNRIIFRNNIPSNRKVLVVSSRSHIDYIFSERFAGRCLTELKYLPYNEMQRLKEFMFSYLPVRESLQMDAMDPLDP